MHQTFGHAVPGLEIRDTKAVVLLSQGIPDLAGHGHQACSIKVGRAVGHSECLSGVGDLDGLVQRVKLSAENFGDHTGRLQKLTRPCRHLLTGRHDPIAFSTAAVEELVAQALSLIMPPHRNGDVPKEGKDPKLRRWRRQLGLVRRLILSPGVRFAPVIYGSMHLLLGISRALRHNSRGL
jgi:hypothetical protein